MRHQDHAAPPTATLAHRRAPAVDIIILEWNRADFTIKAIRSALAQRGVTRKVWVVDQGSTAKGRDRLAAFCDAHSDVHVCWLDRNVGVAEGRNIATRLGHAPYVVSLDNDAVFADDHCVARAVERLQRAPQLGALAFRILDAETGSDADYWDYPPELRVSDAPDFDVTRFLGGGHILRRTAFESAGMYDGRLFFCGEERDIGWRMIGLGYRIRLHRDLTVLHRSVPQSKHRWDGRRFYYLVRNTLYINHKFGAGPLAFARGAAGFCVRGARNGVLSAAVHGTFDGLKMSARFSLCEHDKAPYQLSEQAKQHIRRTDARHGETWFTRLGRQLSRLPAV